MEWKTRLPDYTMDQLQQTARNAKFVVVGKPGTPKAMEAEQLLELIEAEKAQRSLPGSIASFLDKYPQGFDDPLFLKQERSDKVDARNYCQAKLTREAFDSALKGDATSLLMDIKRIINMTNLMQGSFEKPKLLEAIHDPTIGPRFLHEIDVLLHGKADAPQRLAAFSDYMHTLGLRKWTYGTYFLFLNDPQTCMFVKPEGLKKAVSIAGYALDYDAAPAGLGKLQAMPAAKRLHSAQSGTTGEPKLRLEVLTVSGRPFSLREYRTNALAANRRLH